jgi:hypothetical protein
VPHIGTAGWFTQHIWEGIEVTAGQLARLVRPGRACTGRREPWQRGTEYPYWVIVCLRSRPPGPLVLGMLSRRQMYGHQVLREAGP